MIVMNFFSLTSNLRYYFNLSPTNYMFVSFLYYSFNTHYSKLVILVLERIYIYLQLLLYFNICYVWHTAFEHKIDHHNSDPLNVKYVEVSYFRIL